MSYYLYRQNNSGGNFHYDPKTGISKEVYVEAGNAQEADNRAERLGIYFDGDGDCSCCGDRWSSAGSHDKTAEVPGPDAKFVIDESSPYPPLPKWIVGYETFVHPLNRSFYGAHQETSVVNKLTYGGKNGYGLEVWKTGVGNVFAVNEKGWDRSGTRSVPQVENSIYTYENKDTEVYNRSGKPFIRVHRSSQYMYIWFQDRKNAEVAADVINKYLDVTPRADAVRDFLVNSEKCSMQKQL